jgi:phosphoribosyl-ATP pyrophosphohydrolase/phosphoribosyl-AMP cyclohydrolase
MLDISQIDFTKCGGLIPVVIQDNHTLQVLMVGFMNEAALEETLKSQKVTFFSRTKNRLWQKGETSGNYLHVVDIYLDCDKDSLLIMANPVSNTCHTGSVSCFIEQQLPPLSQIGLLDKTILERINTPDAKSYTNELLSRGINKVAQKVGEEAVEVVIAALAESTQEYLGEMTDLVYHMLVLLHAKDLSLAELSQMIAARHKQKASSHSE